MTGKLFRFELAFNGDRIGTKEIPAECNPPRFLRKPAKTFPVYACFFCRCQRGDENGTAFGRGFEQVCRRKDSI